MMLFTERHYRPYVVETKTVRPRRAQSVATMLLTALPAAFSPRWADRMLLRAEKELLATG